MGSGASQGVRVTEGNSRRRRLGAILWCVVVILFGASSIGSQCNPNGGNGNGECGCNPPQESICGRCMPVRAFGQTCTTDECGAQPCENGLFCDGGRCGISIGGTGPDAVCLATAPNTCGTGYYCRSHTCPEAPQTPIPYDRCSAYRLQGEPCGVPPDPCFQCEPGTACINGTCARGCSNYLDCQGCGPYTTCLQTQGAGPSIGPPPIPTAQDVTTTCDNHYGDCDVGNCYSCTAHGATCDDGHPCCDVGDTCHIEQPNGSGTCCVTSGSSKPCNTSADCCPTRNTVCAQGSATSGTKFCQQCEQVGASCFTNAQCCGGSCEAGYCRTGAGDSCTTPNDCPSTAPDCECGVCIAPATYGLGDSCNPLVAKKGKCDICSQVTPGTSCSPSAGAATSTCCVQPLQPQSCTGPQDCCNPPPCDCDGGGGGSTIVCSAPAPGQTKGTCCIPAGSAPAGPRCNPSNDLCCPGSKCTSETSPGGVVYTFCKPT